MTVSTEARATVRAAFGGRCGYCGVSETSVGGELEIDHFHPQAAGGSDAIENLVYACTARNRFKGDYGPAHDAPDSLRLLHPQRDDLGAHIEETVHGRLIGFTPRGWFYIQRLHLNRPQLVEMRHLHLVLQAQKADLLRAREAEARLRRENEVLQGEIARLRTAVDALLRGGER
ncbi:HNH endonuclease signature motif containing protein [Sorangium sp. So ce216]